MHTFIYRPQHKPADALKRDFVIRVPQFRMVMDSVANDVLGESPQHLMIVGQRGMGKTTLLHRVKYQIEEEGDPHLLPIIFSEEQYGITQLYKLWEYILYELDEVSPAYYGVAGRLEAYGGQEYEDFCYALLREWVEKNGHRLVLLIDNLGLLIKKFKKAEQQRLREILITFPGIKIIGTSTAVMEAFYQHDQPFYEFFHFIQLPTLGSAEVRRLLLTLESKYPRATVEKMLSEQPGRLEAMRILTGGVPRTMMLLFDIFLDQQSGNSISDLYELLDRVTPLYKHRMDELPEQQQEIVHVLALHWDGMSVKEIVQKTHLPSKVVSAQLHALAKNQVVEATQTAGRHKLYQLEERFFNIWYLMNHAPRRSQGRVLWLTRFLEHWYAEPRHLTERAHDFMQRLVGGALDPQYGAILVTAFANAKGLDISVRDKLLDTGRAVLGEEQTNLPPLYREIEEELNALLERKAYEKATRLIEGCDLPADLRSFLLGRAKQAQGAFREAEEQYQRAIALGLQELVYSQLGTLYWRDLKDIDKAIETYEKGMAAGDGYAAFGLGLLYQEHVGNPAQAIVAYQKALELGDTEFMISFVILHLVRLSEGEKVLALMARSMETKPAFLLPSYIQILIFTNRKDHKALAVELVAQYSEQLPLADRIAHLPLFWLWADAPERAKEELLTHLPKATEAEFMEATVRAPAWIALAWVKEVPHLLVNLFAEESLGLKEKLKVPYYALMHLLKEEFPNEAKRMPKELQEPVNTMVEDIKRIIKLYSVLEPIPPKKD